MSLNNINHLTPEFWERANRIHLAKAIAEFTHELLIHPEELSTHDEGWRKFVLQSDDGKVVYFFKAKAFKLDHLVVDPASINKYLDNKLVELNSLEFITEFQNSLGISESILPTYLEEITSTLYGAAFMLSRDNISADELTEASHLEIEQAMMAGHPCFVANNGRIGFDTDDYKQYAPETGSSVKLIWLAGHKSKAEFNCIKELSYETLIKKELSDNTIHSFKQTLLQLGLSVEDYFFIPVHPWQWNNKLVMIYATDIAQHKLVYLGESKDQYVAQQSIRTFYNKTNPHKYYTKTALSILNMGFMRGLSPYYMAGTPVITAWITALLSKDLYLESLGFTMLGEVATVGYRNTYFESLGKTNAYNKMLSALWRESPLSVLEKGQKTMTMAALLHIDADGKAFLPQLIKASGISPQEWIKAYLNHYLKPLLHCFYKYDMVFMPHGENLILVMEGNVPVKAIMKDITEEVAVLSEKQRLPEEVSRIYAPTPEAIRTLCIFTDVFDCFFRFMAGILDDNKVLSEDDFWEEVALSIHEYQDAHQEMREKFEQFDLFAEEFKRSCLNRLQLKNNKQMVDLSDPNGGLQFVGTLSNPIAIYKNTFQQLEETV